MRAFKVTVILLATILSANTLLAQTKPAPRQVLSGKVLTQNQWKQVDESSKRGLEWLSKQQQADGSFKTPDDAQPGVTSFCVMAFLAQGESPDGQYEQQLTKAVDYIIEQQKPNGLIATRAPSGVPIPRGGAYTVSRNSAYNHAISALALSEIYGQCSLEQSKRVASVIEKAIVATLEMQQWQGKQTSDIGGWRYLGKSGVNDSDLSVTGWQLMFLRSARNAGFDVPKESIDAAVKYVENCFLKDKRYRAHAYLTGNPKGISIAMAGAGVLAMAHAGKHNSQQALDSGDWVLKHQFSNFDPRRPAYGGGRRSRYLYGCVICSQAMFQLGGKYWEQYFPTMVKVMLGKQQNNGSWPPEKSERQYGQCYSTSLCILSLSVPNQMLPIFQR